MMFYVVARNVDSGVTGIGTAAVGVIAGVRTGIECLPMDEVLFHRGQKGNEGGV